MTPPRRPHVPELRLARHGVVTFEQLLRAGLTKEAVRHRVRTGRLHPRYRGVYAVGRPELTRHGRWLAAVLACGDGAALSHVPAALLWELVDRGDERPHVTMPTRAGRTGPRGITVHRSGTLAAAADVVVRHGVPVTGLTRTLVDLARMSRDGVVREALMKAERVHRLNLRTLRGDVAHPLSAPGRARLRRVLDDYVPGLESELEARFLDLCRRHRLPKPQCQVWIGGHRADFVWHEARLVVETDGRATHDTHVAFLADRVKDRALKAAGYDVLRFTWAEVVHRPAAVAAEIRSALARPHRRGRGA